LIGSEESKEAFGDEVGGEALKPAKGECTLAGFGEEDWFGFELIRRLALEVGRDVEGDEIGEARWAAAGGAIREGTPSSKASSRASSNREV